MLNLNIFLNKLIEVYTFEDKTKFDIGFLLDYDKRWLLLHTYDPYIIEDGIMLVNIDTIWKINFETEYLKAFLNFSAEYNEKINLTTDFINDFINMVINKKIVYISLNNGDLLLGKIIENSDNLVIKNYSNSGELDSYSAIDKNSISAIQYNCRECKNIENNFNKNLKRRSL